MHTLSVAPQSTVIINPIDLSEAVTQSMVVRNYNLIQDEVRELQQVSSSLLDLHNTGHIANISRQVAALRQCFL